MAENKDFTATAAVNVGDAMRLALEQDFVELGVLFMEAYVEVMASVRAQMESQDYHPDRPKGPTLSITFTSTGIPNG